jgi:hypothetical protein
MANGGAGDFGGGGGGGGRVAAYYVTNQFAGALMAKGGSGFNAGQAGSIVLTNEPGVAVVSMSPTGTVTGPILGIGLSFNCDVMPLTAANVIITTPAGVLSPDALVITPGFVNPSILISFPTVNLTNLGVYTVQILPPVQSIQGLTLSAPFTGTFTIIQGKIIGRVTDPNGIAVGNVTLSPSGGLDAVVTDDAGNFAVPVPPNWSGTITPGKPGWAFVPPAMNYNQVSATVEGQLFIALPPAARALSSTLHAGSLSITWAGSNGLNYQLLSSTDLINWTPYGSPMAGANTNLTLSIPTASGSNQFFRLSIGR